MPKTLSFILLICCLSTGVVGANNNTFPNNDSSLAWVKLFNPSQISSVDSVNNSVVKNNSVSNLQPRELGSDSFTHGGLAVFGVSV